MKILHQHLDPRTDTVYYETEYGTFTKRMQYHGYSVHLYSVHKVSGEWPSNEDLMMFCDNRTSDYGGAVVSRYEYDAIVRCYVR